MERGKRIETLLPETIIQQIQSFLNRKEAARTTILSKSWYNAWLTCPTLVFDEHDFQNPDCFEEFATKTIQRYRDLNLKIECFTFRTKIYRNGINLLADKLVVDAMKMGATHLNLELCSQSPTFDLPQEVLRSESLLQLSVNGFEIDGNVKCYMLKSLSLGRVNLKNDDMIRDIVSCCVSIEELSLSNSGCFKSRKLAPLSWKDVYELHKLKHLYLDMVDVDSSFFESFGSRFSCLKDLSLVHCHGYKGIHISSTSLQSISIKQDKALRAVFEVPNLASFSYSGKSIPSLTIEAGKREWESYISIKCHRSFSSAWYKRLLKLLLCLSKISLSLNMVVGTDYCSFFPELDPDETVDVENLTIEAPFDLGCDLLHGLFYICHPKLVTHYWLPRDSCKHWLENNRSLDEMCKQLNQEMINPGNDNMFGRFLLEGVNVEVYEESHAEWRPLLLKERLDALIAPPNKRKEVLEN